MDSYTLGPNTVLFSHSDEDSCYSKEQYNPENSLQIPDWKNIIYSNY